MSKLRVDPINAFSDNYIWCISSSSNHAAVVVDPGDAEPVLKFLKEKDLQLSAVLITHHHWDHTGGLKLLKQAFPELSVYGPVNENIAELTHGLNADDEVFLSQLDCRFKVIEVPGHTAGHLAYYGEGLLFCGDTVFAGGCGRVFDGTFEQLADSLQVLAQLPETTLVYCAHEYTVDNLGFALWVEPDNQELISRDKSDTERAEKGIPTVPSTLQTELKTNPFLRCDQKQVIAAAEQHAGRELKGYRAVFRELREWKDKEYD